MIKRKIYRPSKGWKPHLNDFVTIMFEDILIQDSKDAEFDEFEKFAQPSPEEMTDARLFAIEPDELLISTNADGTAFSWRQTKPNGRLQQHDIETTNLVLKLWADEHRKKNRRIRQNRKRFESSFKPREDGTLKAIHLTSGKSRVIKLPTCAFCL